MCALHKCDTPLCVRPDHLFVGSKADNTQDMMAKGRWRKPPALRGVANRAHSSPEIMPRGEKHRQAKLSDVQVLEIRAAYRSGTPGMKAALARRYGISKTHVARILDGRSRAPIAA
jgi:hypothetical protein